MEQQGNELADIIANEYRRKGQQKTIPYFTESEEEFVFQHNGTLIQGDVRSYLKSLEKGAMLKAWKEKAPKQAEWTSKYSTQIFDLSKSVWRWAIENGEGAAWTYFIFGISQWLPTNHRSHYGDRSGYDRDKCKLCLLNELDTQNHFLICPALQKEQIDLQFAVRRKLRDWHLPFVEKRIQSFDNISCQRWLQIKNLSRKLKKTNSRTSLKD